MNVMPLKIPYQMPATEHWTININQSFINFDQNARTYRTPLCTWQAIEQFRITSQHKIYSDFLNAVTDMHKRSWITGMFYDQSTSVSQVRRNLTFTNWFP